MSVKPSINCLKFRKSSKKKKDKSGEEEETALAKVWRLEYLSTDHSVDHDFELETEYYGSKSLKAHAPKSALEGLRRVVDMEKEPGEWGFRALKQMTKIHSKMDDFREMQSCFSELLPYVDGVLTLNYAQKSVGNLLGFLKSAGHDKDLLERLCGMTLDSVNVPPHDKLWFRVKSLLVDLCVDRNDFDGAHGLTQEMRQFCENLDPASACYKQKELLAICNREIEICSLQKDKSRLKVLSEEYTRLKCEQAV